MLTVRIVPVPSNHSTATSRQPFMTRDAGWWDIWSFRKALTLPWSCYFLKGHPGSLFLVYHPSSPFLLLHMLRSLFLFAVSIASARTVARGYRTLTPCILATQLALLSGDCHHLWHLQINQLHSIFNLPSFSATLNTYKTLFFPRTLNHCGLPVFWRLSSAESWFNDFFPLITKVLLK